MRLGEKYIGKKKSQADLIDVGYRLGRSAWRGHRGLGTADTVVLSVPVITVELLCGGCPGLPFLDIRLQMRFQSLGSASADGVSDAQSIFVHSFRDPQYECQRHPVPSPVLQAWPGLWSVCIPVYRCSAC